MPRRRNDGLAVFLFLHHAAFDKRNVDVTCFQSAMMRFSTVVACQSKAAALEVGVVPLLDRPLGHQRGGHLLPD